MIYSRGSKTDYDNWEHLGNPGWSYKHVLPYFIKSENSQIEGDKYFHGKGGFWNVEYLPTFTELRKIVFNACKELNISQIDYNGHSVLGIATPQQNVLHGVRQSIGTAFLYKARKRRNVTILTKSLVTKLLYDSKNKKVVRGVEFIRNDRKHTAVALKEVILSGGSYNSPQLLLLSGIGPKNELRKLNISVVQDLPAVGRNLIEHVIFTGLSFNASYTGLTFNITEAIKLHLQGGGPFAFPASGEALYFTSETNRSKVVPFVEVFIMTDITNLQRNNIKSETSTKPKTIRAYLTILHPKSRGSVTLKSNNPIDYPNIDVNFLSNNKDVELMIEGIEQYLKLFKTNPFKKIKPIFLKNENCRHFKEYSTEYWKCALRYETESGHHVCCTTAMGSDKKTSVVDTNLKIHGLAKIRVVDAGVFPSIISGHTAAPVVMVAEKISDTIKNEYRAY